LSNRSSVGSSFGFTTLGVGNGSGAVTTPNLSTSPSVTTPAMPGTTTQGTAPGSTTTAPLTAGPVSPGTISIVPPGLPDSVPGATTQ
jgi:hypothetical protein